MGTKMTELFFTDGKSDKTYKVTLSNQDQGWVVNYEYGKRGAKLKSATKTVSPVNYEDAEKIYVSLIKAKKSKGYTEKKSGNIWKAAKLDREITDETRESDILRIVKKLKGKKVEELKGLIANLDEGVLTLSRSLSTPEFVYLFLCSDFKNIKEIRCSSWVSPTDFKDSARDKTVKLEAYLGVPTPDDYWNLQHFWDCYNKCADKAFDLESVWLKGLDDPEGVLAENRLDDKSILLLRHGHHEPNYLPTFNYGSDGVTQGFAYDLQEKKWWQGLVYHGDGHFAGGESIWEELYSNLEPDEPDFLELDDVTAWSEFSKEINSLDKDELPCICAWSVNMILTGFLNQFEHKKLRLTTNEKLRHGDFTLARKLETKEDTFLSKTVYPNVVLSMKRYFSARLTKKDLEVMTSNNYFEPKDPSKLLKQMTVNCKDVLFGKEEPDTVDEFWDKVNIFAIEEVQNSRTWLAVLLSFMYWSWGSTRGDHLMLELLEIIDEDVLPKFIRSTFVQHAQTRYDKTIYL
jgi:predicted DNA-binding WGR domain protein